jgi:hypothetical protein
MCPPLRDEAIFFNNRIIVMNTIKDRKREEGSSRRTHIGWLPVFRVLPGEEEGDPHSSGS